MSFQMFPGHFCFLFSEMTVGFVFLFDRTSLYVLNTNSLWIMYHKCLFPFCGLSFSLLYGFFVNKS